MFDLATLIVLQENSVVDSDEDFDMVSLVFFILFEYRSMMFLK